MSITSYHWYGFSRKVCGWSLKQIPSIKEEAASNAEDDDDVGEHDGGEDNAYATSNPTREEKDECHLITLIVAFLFFVKNTFWLFLQYGLAR